MNLQDYIQKQILWAKCLRRHYGLKDNEIAMQMWVEKGCAKQFANKFRKQLV